MAGCEAFPADVPFSITCESCDAGMEIGSYAEALGAGWTNICYAPEQMLANYLGLCPECRQRQNEKERVRQQRPSLE